MCDGGWGGGCRGVGALPHTLTSLLPAARRCHCLCVCKDWRTLSAALPELWESVIVQYIEYWDSFTPTTTQAMLAWMDAWCARPLRPLRSVKVLWMGGCPSPEGAGAKLLAMLQRCCGSLLGLELCVPENLWQQLQPPGLASDGGFLAALADLRALTSLQLVSHALPPDIRLPLALRDL